MRCFVSQTIEMLNLMIIIFTQAIGMILVLVYDFCPRLLIKIMVFFWWVVKENHISLVVSKKNLTSLYNRKEALTLVQRLFFYFLGADDWYQ